MHMGRTYNSPHEAFPTQRPNSHLQGSATYKAQTLQHLADLAWLFMDYRTKEEMVVDQFHLGMGNHELSMQVTAHGHRRVEDILQVARSLEAVQEEEKFVLGGHKPSTQAHFVTDEHDQSPDTKQLVKDMMARLG